MATNSIFSARRALICGAVGLFFFTTAPLADEPLAVELTTYWGDRQAFALGDDIRLLYSINTQAYWLAIHQDATGVLWQLLPSARFPDATAKPGRYQPFPALDSPLRLIAQPPAGKESIWLFASRRPFPPLPGTTGANGLKRLSPLDIAAIRRTFESQLGTDYAISRLDYEIRD